MTDRVERLGARINVVEAHAAQYNRDRHSGSAPQISQLFADSGFERGLIGGYL
ncbi:hypothetical protein OG530_00435 [Streptomyces decoyicus]|uniref:hypothetical protein n=1 Tax=Streptomyces decoyicus TaxID=249567 RepID=UPI002E182E5F